MIDPTNMTEYGASKHRLEEIILFSLLAANNNAVTAAKGLDRLLNQLREELRIIRTTGPFLLIRTWFRCQKGMDLWPKGITEHDFDLMSKLIGKRLKACGIGKYTRKGRGLVELVHKRLNLRTCSQTDLETVYNIGFKTSRFFILHTRPEANTVDNVALDTHMMSYLQDKGHDVPDNTPGTEKEYKRAAKLFFNHAKESGRSLADFDLMIWNEYSGHNRRKRNERIVK